MASNHDRQRLAPPWIPPATGLANRSRRVIFVDRRPPLNFDAAAQAYITAVEAADGQALEADVRTAINAFVVGCKDDGIWNAIKAACILAGARTLTGALVPLVGAAPTNVNFASGDYNRKTGLIGNASTKHINTNTADTVGAQNNFHMAVRVTTLPSTGLGLIGVGINTTGVSNILTTGNRCRSATANVWTGATGLLGISRGASGSYTARNNGSTSTVTVTSETPTGLNAFVFARNNSGTVNERSNARISFYSMGEALTLALLDSRLTTLINAFSAAIP